MCFGHNYRARTQTQNFRREWRGFVGGALHNAVARGDAVYEGPKPVSQAKTGSGEVKFWHKKSRYPNMPKEERKKELALLRQETRKWFIKNPYLGFTPLGDSSKSDKD